MPVLCNCRYSVIFNIILLGSALRRICPFIAGTILRRTTNIASGAGDLGIEIFRPIKEALEL